MTQLTKKVTKVTQVTREEDKKVKRNVEQGTERKFVEKLLYITVVGWLVGDL